jgi:hypothetical protein
MNRYVSIRHGRSLPRRSRASTAYGSPPGSGAGAGTPPLRRPRDDLARGAAQVEVDHPAVGVVMDQNGTRYSAVYRSPDLSATSASEPDAKRRLPAKAVNSEVGDVIGKEEQSAGAR